MRQNPLGRLSSWLRDHFFGRPINLIKRAVDRGNPDIACRWYRRFHANLLFLGRLAPDPDMMWNVIYEFSIHENERGFQQLCEESQRQIIFAEFSREALTIPKQRVMRLILSVLIFSETIVNRLLEEIVKIFKK
jgi:hypothetical protein